MNNNKLVKKDKNYKLPIKFINFIFTIANILPYTLNSLTIKVCVYFINVYLFNKFPKLLES